MHAYEYLVLHSKHHAIKVLKDVADAVPPAIGSSPGGQSVTQSEPGQSDVPMPGSQAGSEG